MPKALFIGIACALVAASARAQDPQSVLNALIQREMQQADVRQQNEMMRLEIERRNLEQELRLGRATDSQIAQELSRYCPIAGQQCLQAPPDALLQEAAQRGLVQYMPPAAPPQQRAFDCVTIGDDFGGGFTDCH
jgi:hypothetical protein